MMMLECCFWCKKWCGLCIAVVLLCLFGIVSGSVFSGVEPLGDIVGSTVLKEDHDVVHSEFVDEEDKGIGTFEHPHAIIMTPVFETLDKKSDIVAYLVGLLPFDRYLGDLLPEGVDGIAAILRNSCGQSFTYELDGNSVSDSIMNCVCLSVVRCDCFSRLLIYKVSGELNNRRRGTWEKETFMTLRTMT
jgi:hypothetical protein